MAQTHSEFLSAFQRRPVQLEGVDRLRADCLMLGQGPGPLEVVVCQAEERPTSTVMREAWRKRQQNRNVPLIIVALYDGKAAVCGAQGEEPPVYLDVDQQVIERVCETALNRPSRHAAFRFLYSVLPQIDTAMPGIRNEGFLTLHELQHGVWQRPDFPAASRQAGEALGKRSVELLKSLDFRVNALDDYTYVLLSQAHRRAVAVLLLDDESPDLATSRFANQSPVSYALAVAEREGLPYVVLVTENTLRLHPVKDGVGVAQRGRTETYVEVNLDLLPAEKAGYLWLLFSAPALADGGTFDQILLRARDHATHVGTRLRQRIYEDVIPKLAMAIWDARGITEPTVEDRSQTYQMAMLALFRLLFIAYAEDKDLLPYRTNEAYRRRSLKAQAQEMLQIRQQRRDIGTGTSYWDEIRNLWRAVDEGRPEWGIPEYDGHLFTGDPEVSPIGAVLETLSLANATFVPVLQYLLVDFAPAEGFEGPVDFSALGVREFGTIYEGLLENDIAIAEQDLTIKRVGDQDVYWPVEKATRRNAEVKVHKGEAYLHTASGARKATGSYYTKDFAVQHLLDHALEPALKAHLERLDQMDDDAAAEVFFDFRVADISMGSGHFLVAAVDRIERHLSQYLAGRSLPAVREELARLRASALKALGAAAEAVTIEETQLLRRQIARRCVYGVDINVQAVQLARVSLWIHTFVPGLALSFLDHNLVEGNSLVGIATIEEAREELNRYAPNLFTTTAESLLGAAREPLERLAHITDADAREVDSARRALREAQEAIAPTRALFDVLTAARMDADLATGLTLGVGDDVLSNWHDDPEQVLGSDELDAARQATKNLLPFHFPIAFPEVFLRDNGGGFDCILGNPPWEKPHVEDKNFWGRHFPGYFSLSQREREAYRDKLESQRPDLVAELAQERATDDAFRSYLDACLQFIFGSGHMDLYQAFAWRFWQLIAAEGSIGVVLPRQIMMASPAEHLRRLWAEKGVYHDLTFLLNRQQWVFDDAHPQYTIALMALRKTPPTPEAALPLRGPYSSLASYEQAMQHPPVQFAVNEVLNWTTNASLPLLPDEEGGEVFVQLRAAPRLDAKDGDWRARPLQGDLNATTGKPLMDLDSSGCPRGFWPVYKGESFDIWQPDTGTYYAWANPKVVVPHLQDRRVRGGGNSKSPFSEFDKKVLRDVDTLPSKHARIALRDVTNRTNQRTVIAALVPPRVILVHTAPYLLWPSGNEMWEAYLLGVLCSRCLDWCSRRFVELHLTFGIFNALPVPRPGADNALRQRVVQLAGRLASPDERFAEWAEKVGVEWGPLGDVEKDDMICELDAVVAHLYGLSERQLTHIFETFHEGWDYHTRLRAVLKHFNSQSAPT